MWDLAQLLLFSYLVSLGFLRVRRFYTTPLTGFVRKQVVDDINGPNISTITLPISVIIPARNEELRLPALLESLNNQTRRPQEIIVVDDASTDGTAELARRYGCRVVRPEDKRWAGKSAACYAGAQAATGEYLLFFDADVFLTADALEYLYRYSRKGEVLSVQPYHYMERAYEQCSLYFNLVALLGLDLGRRQHPFDTKLGFFGPCMLLDRETYLKTGGHTLVRDSILEDMALGQAFVKQKIPLYSIPHNKRLSFRMYAEGFRQLFNGWSKNMALGAQRSNVWTILIISSIMALSFIIPVELLKALLRADFAGSFLYTGAFFAFAGLLYLSARQLGFFRFWSCLCFPLMAFFFVVVFLRSFLMQLLHVPIEWRGRRVRIQ